MQEHDYLHGGDSHFNGSGDQLSSGLYMLLTICRFLFYGRLCVALSVLSQRDQLLLAMLIFLIPVY